MKCWYSNNRKLFANYTDTVTNTLFKIDNQLQDATSPIVLYPTPMPQHMVKRVGERSCIELVCMKRHRPIQNQKIYK